MADRRPRPHPSPQSTVTIGIYRPACAGSLLSRRVPRLPVAKVVSVPVDAPSRARCTTRIIGIITKILRGVGIVSKPRISERPLIGLFGSESAYRVLMYLENYGKGYASEIARTFGIALNQAQNQLKKFEEIGLLISRIEGTTRMYYFKRGPISDALQDFLRTMLELIPNSTVEEYFRQRSRPRRFAK